MTVPPNFIDDPRFSRIFELPSDPGRGRTKPFKLQYADYGYRNEANPEQERVFLFFAGLMGSRLIHTTKDELAKRHKVRIISADRPGVGGTDAVGVEESAYLWRGECTTIDSSASCIQYCEFGFMACH
jgi:hypothetical protein